MQDTPLPVIAPPTVTVLMLTFNRPQFISRAIESIRGQTHTNWELIVVQDGDNREIVSLLKDWESRESRIRYFHRTEKGNIADATNYGLARARGRYLAILDDDDYWLAADKLERQIRFLDENPDHAGCGGGVVCIDESGKETLRYLKPEKHHQIAARALMANPMAHSTCLYRVEAVRQIGGYDATLAGFQDWDVCLKLAKIGKLYNFQDYFLAYQIWEGGGSFAAQRRNTECSVKIVKRHGGDYPSAGVARALAYAYYLYARTPIRFRQATFSILSRLKKSLS